jgi:hypothetical protein
MPVKTDSLNRDLYKLLKVRGYDPIPKGSDGETVPVPDEAEVFKFTFKKDGNPVDTAWVTIDSNQDLKIYYDDDIADSTNEDLESGSFDDSWTGFLQQLKMWSQRRQLGFDTENKDHLASDMAQRDHMKKKENIAEGYYPMGKQASYSDAIPSVKIILQHNRKLEEGEQRYRNISRIFVENANGERFLLNTTKPGLARVYARHIAEGGTPYDDRASHIQSLVEEYEKMAGFVRATRNGQFNESTQRLVLEGANHYQSLRETLSRMTGRRGYNMYFESWTPALMEDDSEVSGINELFVQETLDPRIESAMPILKKLHKKLGEMKEVSQLEEWADSLVNEYKQGDDSGYIQLLQSKLKAGKPLTPQEKEKLKAYLAAKQLGLKEEGDSGQTALNPVGIPEDELDEGKGAIRKFLAGLGIIGALGAHISSEDEAIIQRMAVKYDQAQTPQEKAQIKHDIERVTKGSLVKEEDIEESGLQAYFGNKKYGKEGMDALRKAGRDGASKEKMASIRSKYDKLDEEDMAEGEFFNSDYIFAKDGELWKKTIEGGSGTKQDPYTAKFNEPLRVLAVLMRSLALQMDGKDPKDTSQFGPTPNKLYYKHNNQLYMGDGTNKIMSVDKTDHEGMAEDLDANQKRVGQLGPTEKVGPKGAVGKLVGASESFINTVDQAVTTEGVEELAALKRLLGK